MLANPAAFFIILSLIGCWTVASSYRILVPIITPSRSHYNQAKAICDILHERGHEITFINGYPGKKLPYREIIIPEITKNLDFEIDFESSGLSIWEKFDTVSETRHFVTMMYDNAFQSEIFQKFLNDKTEKFDLVIMDYVINEAFFGISVKYNCPLIVIAPGPMIQWLARLSGNPTSPATIPNYFLDYTSDMTFKERVINTIMGVFVDYNIYFVYDAIQKSYYEKYFAEEASRVEYSELKKAISFVYVNSHPTFGYIRPYMPNSVEIGGFHMNEASPLPKEYQDLLDNSKNGVIFFSLGSFIKTHTMPKRLRDIFLRSLSKLNETVLWKFESDLEGLPKNVIIRKWMPQSSILCHPNVKLFITHGGILSIYETVKAGIPALSIPVDYDQFQNAKMIEDAKTGITLKLGELSEELLDQKLNEVLTNKKYTENAKKLKELYTSRPIPPKDLVAFYAEHVIKTGGAKHLSPPHLNLLSAMLVDVLVVLLIPPIVLLGVFIWVCSKICCSKKKTLDKNNKQKLS